jgi:hypothetical protein
MGLKNSYMEKIIKQGGYRDEKSKKMNIIENKESKKKAYRNKKW